jgi:hypothetical protein
VYYPSCCHRWLLRPDERLAEEKRENRVREEIEVRKLAVEELKQEAAMEDVALRGLKFDRNNN